MVVFDSLVEVASVEVLSLVDNFEILLPASAVATQNQSLSSIEVRSYGVGLSLYEVACLLQGADCKDSPIAVDSSDDLLLGFAV